jgi:hypothetical protein
MKILIAFVFGFVVATVGLGNLASFADRQVDNAKSVVRDNVR